MNAGGEHSHAPARRSTDSLLDYRLELVERAVDANTRETVQLSNQVGSMQIKLDERYMPREEMQTVYVPRREHEERRDKERNLRWNIPLVVFAGAELVLNLILVLHVK